MIIKIDDNSKYSAAMDLVGKKQYFDALCLFSEVDGYESMLNQIGCLMALGDISYSLPLFRRLLARYGTTHNCYDDVEGLGPNARDTSRGTFGNVALSYKPFQLDKRISADPKKLAFHFSREEQELHDCLKMILGLEGYRRMFGDGDDWEDYEEPSDEHFDPESDEYVRNLYYKMMKCVREKKLGEAQEIRDEFMNSETYDPDLIKLQLRTAIRCHLCAEGMDAVDRLINTEESLTDEPPMDALVLALEQTRIWNDDELATDVLTCILDHSDEIELCQLYGIAHTSASMFGACEFTQIFTDMLYDNYDLLGCSSLLLCARNYLTLGNYKLAREAALRLVKAAPWDCYGQTLLRYVGTKGPLIFKPIPVKVDSRRYDVPPELSIFAYRVLKQDLEDDGVISAENYCLIELLYMDATTKRNVQKQERERLLADFRQYFQNIPAEIQPKFIELAKDLLISFRTENYINVLIFEKIMQCGCFDDVMLENGLVNKVSLSKVTLRDDPLFRQALGFGLVFGDANVRSFEKNYLMLCERLNAKDGKYSALQVGYAALAINKRAIAKRVAKYYFDDTITECYNDYLKTESGRT